MNSSSVCIILLLLSGLCKAQAPDFFVDGSRWVYTTLENSEPGQQLVYNWTEQLIIHGDTLINGIPYQKLYTTRHQEIHVFFPPSNPIIHSYDSTGPVFLRYDLLLKQVFYLPSVDSRERLIYDFTLKVGDTLPMQSLYFPHSVIGSIDTITIFGVQAKRFFIDIGDSGFEEFNYIIEGIGGSNGLLFFQPVFASLSGGTLTTLLNCFQMDNSTFPDSNAECPFIDFISATVPIKTQTSLTVTPNPTYGPFSVQITEHLLGAHCFITDGIGRLIQTFKLDDMDTSGQLHSPGIYFWRVEKDGFLVKSGKIVCN